MLGHYCFDLGEGVEREELEVALDVGVGGAEKELEVLAGLWQEVDGGYLVEIEGAGHLVV